MRPEGFVLHTPVYLWVLTCVGFLALLAIDLFLMTRRKARTTMRGATIGIAVYILIAIAFGLLLILLGRGESAAEYFAGYVTEYSLSVDNLFVFVLIMTRFKVPAMAEEKVLLIGIVLSLVLRAVFILAGTALISAASWTFFLFGALLVYTAWKLVTDEDGPDDAFEEGRAVRTLRRVLPLTDNYDGQRIRVRTGGKTRWTPLILPIAAITIANFVFALDSMPAIFGLTQDSFVILAANAFALLGLRQLYFLIEGLLAKLIYLNYGLALILAFIGVKLVDEGFLESGVHRLFGVGLPEIGIGASMTFIAVVLAAAAVASVIGSSRQPEQPARVPFED
jgi:TerC family integral membrane protein